MSTLDLFRTPLRRTRATVPSFPTVLEPPFTSACFEVGWEGGGFVSGGEHAASHFVAVAVHYRDR